jgi:hypothetical protein
MSEGKLTEAERALLPSAVFEAEHERAQLANIRMALNGEQARIKFIREAAIGHYEHGAWEAEECWRRAKLLWDAKPEDC